MRVEITWEVLSEKTIVKNSLIMIVCVVKNSYFYAWVNKVRVKRLKEQTENFKEHISIPKEYTGSHKEHKIIFKEWTESFKEYKSIPKEQTESHKEHESILEE